MSKPIPISTHKHARQLLELVQQDTRFVVGSIDPDHPDYAGYYNLEQAVLAADDLKDATSKSFLVFELWQDAQGQWVSDFEDKR